jgi:acyl-CoA synthetase (NDP forming)
MAELSVQQEMADEILFQAEKNVQIRKRKKTIVQAKLQVGGRQVGLEKKNTFQADINDILDSSQDSCNEAEIAQP